MTQRLVDILQGREVALCLADGTHVAIEDRRRVADRLFAEMGSHVGAPEPRDG